MNVLESVDVVDSEVCAVFFFFLACKSTILHAFYMYARVSAAIPVACSDM